MLSPDADDSLAVLLTFTGSGISTPIRICDSFTQRISSLTTDDEVVYGIVSRTNNFIFVPFQITLPDEQIASAPRCQLTMFDVTRYLTPIIRSITSPPNVLIELVMRTAPNSVEISFGGFQMGAVTYNADQVTAELVVQSLAAEPFPQHTFTPTYFPGLF
jgi:hypothetical protein